MLSTFHNLDSDVDQHEWTEIKHSQKKYLDFTEPVYKETVAICDINGMSRQLVEEKLGAVEKLFCSYVSPG